MALFLESWDPLPGWIDTITSPLNDMIWATFPKGCFDFGDENIRKAIGCMVYKHQREIWGYTLSESRNKPQGNKELRWDSSTLEKNKLSQNFAFILGAALYDRQAGMCLEEETGQWRGWTSWGEEWPTVLGYVPSLKSKIQKYHGIYSHSGSNVRLSISSPKTYKILGLKWVCSSLKLDSPKAVLEATFQWQIVFWEMIEQSDISSFAIFQ